MIARDETRKRVACRFFRLADGTLVYRLRNTMSILGVLALFSAWLAISNHCALSTITTKTDPSQQECPFHPKPAKQPGNSSNLLCCKILRAVFPTIAKDWARDDANFSAIDFGVVLRIVLTESHGAAPLLLDTGPPGKTSFVELIGSLHAHAPPSRV